MFSLNFPESNERQTNLAGSFGIVSRFGLAAILLVSCSAFAGTRAQDISGGAGEGGKKPAESSTKKRPKTTTKPKSTKSKTTTTATGTTVAQPKPEVSRQVNEALQIATTARDSNPPRYGEAEQAYRLAIGLDPEDARAYVGLGINYIDQRHYGEAISALDRAITLDPQNTGALVALANANNAQELYPDAERAALRALAINPNLYGAYKAIGWSKFRRKNLQEAETAYRRAIALSPKTAEIYSELGLVLMELGRWRDTEPIMYQAVGLDPSNAANHAYYGVVLQKLGQVAKSKEAYALAIQLNPRMSTPHSNLALIQFTQGDFIKAREEWTAALRLNSTYALDRVGLLILDRKFIEAQAELEKFTQANPTDEDGWLLLGDVRRMQRDASGSRAAYARAAQLAPEYAQIVRPTLVEPAVAKASPSPPVKTDSKSTSRPTTNPATDYKDTATQPTSSTTEPALQFSSSVRTVKPTNAVRPTPASGSILVRTNANAVVLIEFVGGGLEAQMTTVPASLTEVSFNQLRPGEYRVAISLDGFVPVEKRVFVAVVKIVSIKIALQPKSK